MVATLVRGDVARLDAETRLAAADAPTIVAPLDGSALGDYGVTLRWTNPGGATQNHLTVAPAKNDGPGVNVIFNAASSFTIPPPPAWFGLLPDVTYTWEVRATSATTSIGADSPEWGAAAEGTFRTPRPSIATLTLVSPADKQLATLGRPFLQWSDANSRLFYYEVQLSRDPAFNTDPATARASVYWELRHGAVTFPPNSYRLPEGVELDDQATYYWRARPRVQADGAPVDWSPAAAFFVSRALAPSALPANFPGGGTLELPELHVPAGETVDLGRATTLLVSGPVDIAGALRSRGDLTVVAGGNLRIAGSVTAEAAPGDTNGGSVRMVTPGTLDVMGVIGTGSGRPAAARVLARSAYGGVMAVDGGAAGNGGSVHLEAAGPLTVGAGATIRTGDGSPGAPANASAGGNDEVATALGGKGGDGGTITLRGSQVVVGGSGRVFTLGHGAPGGAAVATSAMASGRAAGGLAVGGAGGGGGRFDAPGLTAEQVRLMATGGNGGPGGKATTLLQPGSPASAIQSPAFVRRLLGPDGVRLPGDGQDQAATGGDGGDADLGDGGEGAAAETAPATSGVDGGRGGNTLATGGSGGISLRTTGGSGGGATAGAGGSGGHGPRGGPGGSARAVGGNGGRGGLAHGPGGNASADGGGRGGDSSSCDPLANGGIGGTSSAAAGQGNPGGNAYASAGGAGGTGAACCPPRTGPGAAGGTAGWSSARGGPGTNPQGQPSNGGDAETAPLGGRGGTGGDGVPPGAGGQGGTQVTIPGPPQGTGTAGLGVPGRPGTGGRSGDTCARPTRTPTPTPTPAPPGSPGEQGTPTTTPGTGITATPTVTRTVTPTAIPGAANRAPRILTFRVAFTPATDVTDYTVSAVDPDGDPLTYLWTLTAPCGTLTRAREAGPTQGYNHTGCTLAQENAAVITIEVFDGKGGRAVYTQPARASEGTTVTVTAG